MGAPIELAVLEEIASPEGGPKGTKSLQARGSSLAPPRLSFEYWTTSRWHTGISMPLWRRAGGAIFGLRLWRSFRSTSDGSTT